MKQSIITTSLAFAILTVGGSWPTQAQVFGVNLIANGGAEAGPGSPDGSVVGFIPNWLPSGNFTVVQYGATEPSGAFPAPWDPGPDSRGVNFFAGGPANQFSSASQVVSLVSYASAIDAGGLPFALSGYFGGWLDQNDYAVLEATFRDASGDPLSSASIGAVSAFDRGNAIGLLFRDGAGLLPVGTRDVLLTLNMIRTDGQYNDGYADDLSFVVIPEPAALTLAGLAAAGLIIARRRR